MTERNDDSTLNGEEEILDEQEVEIEEDVEPQENAELASQMDSLRKNLALCEDKLKRSLADYQNLEKKTRSDIESGVNEKLDRFMLKFLSIYDDLVRAKEILKDSPNAKGMDFIVKNIDDLLAEHGVVPIDALGELFDPNLHEAISVVEDAALEDGTITKEIRKGYISHKKTLRPTLVEISKNPQSK